MPENCDPTPATTTPASTESSVKNDIVTEIATTAERKRATSINGWIIAILIFALALIISSFILSRFILNVRNENKIITKGYAEKTVTSSVGVLRFTITVRNSDLTQGFKALTDQSDIIEKLLKKIAFVSGEIQIDSIKQYPVNRILENGRETNDLLYYNFSRSYTLRSGGVTKIANAIPVLERLLGSGINISLEQPEYSVANLEAIKMELTTQATQSATARAKLMAKQCDARLGALLNARQGIIQITPIGSTDTSDGGCYDTSTIAKVVKLVVSLEYAID